MTSPEAPVAPPLNVLSFRFVLEDVEPDRGGGGDATLRPVIDGVDVLDSAPSLIGRDPDALLGPSLDLLPSFDGCDVAVGVCTCGELGCDAFRVVVRRDGDVVRWSPSDRGQTVRQTYVFGLVRYLDALDAARALRPHEGRGRRIAHEIRGRFGARYGVDRPLIQSWARIEWVSSWPWTSDTVRACVEPSGGPQDVLDLAPLPGESDHEAAVRIGDLLVDLAARRPGGA